MGCCLGSLQSTQMNQVHREPWGAAPMARYLLDSILNLAVGPGLIPAEKRGKQAQERSSGSPPKILKEGGAAG